MIDSPTAGKVTKLKGRYAVRVVREDQWEHGVTTVFVAQGKHVVIREAGDSVHIEITGLMGV